MTRVATGIAADLEWVLEVREPMDAGSRSAEFLLTLVEKHSQQSVKVLERRCEREEFERLLKAFGDSLSGLREAAESRFAALFAGSPSAQASPEGLWRELAASPSDQALFEAFNRLDPAIRGAVAEHVFSRVSMFSGKGPTFAEHYNAANRLLE